MSTGEHNTQSLIDSLSSDLKEVKVCCHPLKKALPWILGSFIYLALGVFVFGVRFDMGERLLDSTYLFEMGLIVAMSFSAALCSLWLSVPDMRGQRWMLAVPITFFGALVFWIALRFVFDLGDMPHIGWHHCLNEAIIFGAIPAAALCFLSSRGKTTQPGMMLFMNVIAIGGLGYIGLRIVCGSDDIGHLFVFHFFPYIVIGLFISALGRRIYRW